MWSYRNFFFSHSLSSRLHRVLIRGCRTKAHKLDVSLFFLYTFLSIYLWLYWVWLSGLLWLQCMGFSLQWLLSLQSTGSRARAPQEFGSWALEHRLSSCSTGALLLRPCGIFLNQALNLCLLSSALAGGVSTSEPPGKPCLFLFLLLSETSLRKCWCDLWHRMFCL